MKIKTCVGKYLKGYELVHGLGIKTFAGLYHVTCDQWVTSIPRTSGHGPGHFAASSGLDERLRRSSVTSGYSPSRAILKGSTTLEQGGGGLNVSDSTSLFAKLRHKSLRRASSVGRSKMLHASLWIIT
ncbi:hypothetical protein Bbelb_339670 [Branchiostoma belcheri]|nr:hypothetical protein Bbelb_339670 [Branchiostoma belcheri]